MLQEISRCTIPITRNDEASLSWHNSILTVCTEKDITFYELANNLQSLDKKIDYVAQSIAVSESSPLTGYVPNKFLSEGVSNIDYTEMIMDPSLWPHNQELMHEMVNIADYRWSPVGIIPNNECTLAVLNNVGCLKIYRKERLGWSPIFDLSDVIKEYFLASDKSRSPRTLQELKDFANALETCAITWCPKLDNGSGLIATCLKNGNILVWQLQYKNSVMKPKSICEIPTEFSEVVALTWIPKSNNEFLLVCSNIYGQIYVLDCTKSDSQIDVQNKMTLWPQKDKMVTKYISYKIIDDKIVLVCNKHRHLLFILIDKTCNVLAQYVRNINDYRITDIISNNHGIFLTTSNCKIYKIALHVLGSELNIEPELIEINESFSTYEMYGITFSTNNVIWAAVMKNRKILHRQRAMKYINIVFFYAPDSKLDELQLLLENPTKKLTDYWDCIELLRYKTFKSKLMPQVDYNILYQEAKKDIYKLKLYYVFLNFFLGLEKLAKNPLRQMLPEISLNVVKEKIMALHASQLITEVHECRKNGEEMLEHQQLESYTAAKRYLSYYCTKYKQDIQDFVDLKEIIKLKIGDRYICQSCDEEINNNFTCNNGHFNMFCSLTFTPIDGSDYLFCNNCNSTARVELYSNNPICIFCDLYLSDSRWDR